MELIKKLRVFITQMTVIDIQNIAEPIAGVGLGSLAAQLFVMCDA